MREIKFRAWDGQVMFSVNVLAIGETGWDCEKGRGVSLPYQPHIKVMQYTGITDKTGKEIFDGDRVKFKHVIMRSIKPQISTGEIMWDSSDACFFIMSDDDSYPHVQFWYAADIEVIGNTYGGGGKE